MKIKIFAWLKKIFNIKAKPSQEYKKMVTNKSLENLFPDQAKLDSKIFNLVINRVLKRVYAGLDEKGRQNMEEVFVSGDEKSKENFIKEYIPDFGKVFEEESKKVEEEIKVEMEKQVSK